MSASSIIKLARWSAIVYLLLALLCFHYDLWLAFVFALGGIVWLIVALIWNHVKQVEGE